MFNAFGDNRSVGTPGRPGKDSFDLIHWIPHTARKMFRESELINIYFDTPTDGIIFEKDNPIGLKNHGIGPSVDLVNNFPEITQIRHGKYMAELKNALFKIKPIQTGVTSPSMVLFALSFKGINYNINPRILFSNENMTRGITIQDRPVNGEDRGFLKILSSGTSKEIEYDRTEWSILLIQYRCINNIVYCRYILNEEIGTLKPGKQDKKDGHTLYLGGHPNQKGAYTALGSFEVFYSDNGNQFLSDDMCKCLLRDISVRVDEQVIFD